MKHSSNSKQVWHAEVEEYRLHIALTLFAVFDTAKPQGYRKISILMDQSTQADMLAGYHHKKQNQ